MKIGLSTGLGFLLGSIGNFWSGSQGVSIRGIFGSKEGCLIFHKLYLTRRKSIAESIKDTKVELNEKGFVATSDGKWYTASCLRSTELPSSAPDFSGVEDALREIAINVIR